MLPEQVQPVIKIAAGACLAVILAAGCARNRNLSSISGTWMLDVKESDWGRAVRPASVVIHIRYDEPKLAYSGEVIYPSEDRRSFSFEGASDGGAYAAVRSYGPGTIVFERAGARTLRSTFRSDDRLWTERATTRLVADGNTMFRDVAVTGPNGHTSWMEVYHRHGS